MQAPVNFNRFSRFRSMSLSFPSCRILSAFLALPLFAAAGTVEAEPISQPAPARVKTEAGEVPNPVVAIRDVCAWPNLTRLPDGTIAAVIFNQPAHLTRPGDVECWVSEDGGKTWQKRGTPGPGAERGVARGNVAAGLAGNGDLLVLVSGWSGPFDGKSRGEILPLWISRSADGGRTWSIDRTSFPRLPDGQHGVPFGDILSGDDGQLRAAVYRENRTWFFRSADDGKSWGDPVLLTKEDRTNEVAPLHLGAGKWLAAARFDGLGLYQSNNDAHSWAKIAQVTGPQQHPAHLVRLRDGRLLLTYGNRVQPRGVDARVSSDEGKTWSEPVRVLDFEGDGGYPASVQLENGDVLTAYYASRIADHDGYHMGTVSWSPGTTFRE